MRFVAIVMLVMSVTFVCSATQENPQERIAELEEETQQLRQELAELRLALSQLQREVQAREELETTEGSSHEDPAEPDDEEEAEDVRTYDSADEIYRAIPNELRPAREGWDVVQKVEVGQWLAEHIPGSRFEARLEVHRMQITYDTTREDWGVSITFKYREMRFMSWDMEERVGTVVLRGDRDFADRARRLEEGARVSVVATIDSTSWDVAFVGSDQIWHPSFCRLRLSDVEARSPHLRR